MYAAGSEKEKGAGGRLHGGTIAHPFVFCKGGGWQGPRTPASARRWGRMVLSWRAPSIRGGSGLACAVVPPAHPPTFGVQGDTPCTPGGGCAPCTPLGGRSRSCVGAFNPFRWVRGQGLRGRREGAYGGGRRYAARTALRRFWVQGDTLYPRRGLRPLHPAWGTEASSFFTSARLSSSGGESGSPVAL